MVLLALYWTFHPAVVFALRANHTGQHHHLACPPKYPKQNKSATLHLKQANDQTATIDGQYIDKKGNPIQQAEVEYARDGLVIANDLTDQEGNFSMDVLLVGVDDLEKPESKEPLLQNYPNPFRNQTTIEASIEQEGTFRIFDMTGKLIVSEGLNNPGDYKIVWGGMGLPDGMYIYNISAGNQSISKKMISMGAGFNGLSINYEGQKAPSLKSGEMIIEDSMSFSKPHTTFIQYPFELEGDTSFVQIGNPGPNEFNPISNTSGVVGDTLEWFVPNHVYNDEATNLYNPTSPNTWVSNDTLYFAVTQAGTTPVGLKVTDVTDNSLEILVGFNVSTSNSAPYMIANIPDTTLNEEQQYIMNLSNYFADNEGDSLMYTFENLTDADVDSIVSDIAYLTPHTDWTGVMEDIRVKASDGQFSVFSNEWDWTVLNINDPPYEVSVIPTQQCLQGDTAWIWVRPNHADDVDSPILTYIANNMGGNATYTTRGDSLGLIPNEGFSGTMSGIVINVDDGQYNINLTPFDLNVILSNNPPVQTNNVPDQFSDEDITHELYMLDYVNDPDNDPLVYTVAGLQNSNYWSSNDTIYFDPDLNWNGVEQNVEITASDGIDQVVLNIFDWYVAAVNDPPYITGNFINYVMDEDNTLAIPLRPSKFDDVDSPVLTYTPNNLLNATHSVNNDTMYIYPNQDWNGIIAGINVTASDGQYQVTGNSFNITVNPMPDLPQQIANIPTQNSDEDNTHIMDMLTYFYNPDGDQMSYVVINQQNSSYSVNLDDVSLIPNANWYGTESGLEIIATNSAGSINSNGFNHNVASVNDPPQVNPDSDSVDEGQFTITDVVANDTDNLDPNGAIDPTSVAVTAQPAHGNVSVNPSTGAITYTSIPGWSGTDQYTYQAGDNGTPQLFDDAIATITVNPAPAGQVYIKVMDIMMDTLLSNCTLHIGSNSYNLSVGDTTMTIAPGTYEFHATHPDALDGKPSGPPGQYWPEFDAIQRPGQNANVEQRAYNDQTSPVTFSGNADTLYIYKIMDDFDMNGVNGIIGSGPQGQTHRFSDNDLDAPAWVNLNYTAPTTTTETRMQYWIAQLIPATKGKLDMVYQQGTTAPSVPYLEMAIDPSFNPSNATSTINNEIDWCYAHWPDNSQSKYVIGIEMLQAVGDLNDIAGTDPPILSYENGDWVINHTGQECFKVLYNFDPGTKF